MRCGTILTHTQNGNTALTAVCQGPSPGGNVEICRLLLENGADMHHTNTFGWTSLLRAGSEGKLDIIRLLIGNGADVNGVDHVSNHFLCK